MSHTPWTQEDAEKWADLYVDETLCGEPINEDHCHSAFLRGLAKAAEVIDARDEEFYVREIEKWQFAWMNVTGTTEEDSKNYRERSRGIDANMRYDLARRLVGVRTIDSDERGSGR